MHHAVIDRWSRGESSIHRRDARAKIVVAVALLAGVGLMPRIQLVPVLAWAALLTAGIVAARLPLPSVLARAAVVLPFSATFAAISLATGQSERALALVVKSYLSAAAVLLLVGTTRLPQLLRGLEALGLPRFLILVVQFLYRYLFVISEQAQHMRLAAGCRAGGGVRGESRFRAAAGAVAVLFARSYERAEAIHHAMLARGFSGHIEVLGAGRFGMSDGVFVVAGLGLIAAIGMGGAWAR